MDNLIKSNTDLLNFGDKRFKFIVSSRRITPDVSVMDYIKVHYIYIKPEQVEHIFGSVTMNSKLYGGRKYNPYNSLTESHVEELYANGIGVSLNLTNHFFDKEAYESSFGLLEKFHRPSNSLIITNDDLARNVRKDFPEYKLKASIIKNITNMRRLENACEIYDYVTLPMDLNDDDDFLANISQKDKVILFANANCAYKCPARTCYYGFSQFNRGEEVTSICSKETMPRLDHGPVYFDLAKLAGLGFTRFKLVPLFFEEADKVTKLISWTKSQSKKYYKKPDAAVISCPKSGRTWLRFILANYLNQLCNLNLNVDLHSFFNILPNDTNDEQKGLGAYQYYNREDVPFIIFSHKRNKEIEYRGKHIFLLRSPYDMVVSDYFQQTEHLNRYKGTVKEFIRDEKKGINKICDFYNSWNEVLTGNNVFITSYEELSSNIYNTIEKLLTYLEINIDETKLKVAIEASGFCQMQDLEKRQGIPYVEYNRENTNALRMREGKTGSHKNYLDEEDINYINSIMEDKFHKTLWDILIYHSCLNEKFTCV